MKLSFSHGFTIKNVILPCNKHTQNTTTTNLKYLWNPFYLKQSSSITTTWILLHSLKGRGKCVRARIWQCNIFWTMTYALSTYAGSVLKLFNYSVLFLILLLHLHSWYLRPKLRETLRLHATYCVTLFEVRMNCFTWQCTGSMVQI